MAAITTAVMAHVNAGDRVVTTREIYGGTFELMDTILPGSGCGCHLYQLLEKPMKSWQRSTRG